jgi:hypothetical protein
METVLGAIVGIGLSAACGFRVFVPFLVMSAAHMSGHLALAPGFEWIGSWPALIAFGTASALEIGAYYVPWLDNALDTIATPAAIVAGTVVCASQVTDVSPFLHWSLAIIAGGGACALIQAGTVALRTTSTGTTLGLANPLVATAELGASLVITVLAIVVPVVCLLLLLVIAYKMVRALIASPLLKRKHVGIAE